MLFVGRLDSVATTNIEAVQWFVKDVFPKVLNESPNAKLVIAGANPTQEIRNLECNNIRIIPNYKSLEAVYSLADVVLLPLLSGGGVKGKLLEAAAFNKIIISTNHGIEGTEFKPDKDVLLGNTADEFAQCCLKVLNDVELSKTMAKNANSLFLNLYDWNSIGERYNKFLLNECKDNSDEN